MNLKIHSKAVFVFTVRKSAQVKHNVLAIIPARGGSKGVPRKNIKDINGKPLLAYTIESAAKSKLLDTFIVSTEDNEIAGVAKKYHAEVVKRPSELARDDSPTSDAIFQVFDHFKNLGKSFNIVVLLEPTSPLRKDNDIDNALKLFIDNYDKADSLVSLGEVQMENPYIQKLVVDGLVKPLITTDKDFKRRQELPKTYFPYGVIYLSKTDAYIKTKSFYQERTIPYFIERWQNYEIDDMCDYFCIEALMKAKKSGKLG
jgi:CMP-N,N'-diacetyllegionaminic acid synthase